MRWMRLFYYLSINVIVSALTTLMVLVIWGQIHPSKPCVIDPAALKAAGQAMPTLVWTPLISETPTPETAEPSTPATPTPITPTPILYSGIITHTVKTGETLGIIAGIYGVTVEDIMALNHLDNPNLVEIGQKLRIQIPPTETPTPTQTPTITSTPTPPTPSRTPTPITPTLAPYVVIEAVVGVGDLTTERLDLTVQGGGAIDLTGWQVKDEQGHAFTFPSYILHPGGQLSLFTRTGPPSVGALYWGLGEAVWSSGETVTLVDAQGSVRATYRMP
jgi:LysM domain/Lamin Tail Domain